MSAILLFVLPAALAIQPFGGADIEFNGEFDAKGPEVIVDLGARPLQVKKGTMKLTWAPTTLSWGVYPAEDRLDRFDLVGVEGRVRFPSEKSAAYFWVGQLFYDQDANVLDLGFGGGGIEVKLPQGFTAVAGADLRFRMTDVRISRIFDDEPDQQSFLLGVPLGLRYKNDQIGPAFYTEAELGLRPAVGLLGNVPLALDAHGQGELGLKVVEEKNAEVRAYVGYSLRFDTFTELDYAGMEHRVMVGARARF